MGILVSCMFFIANRMLHLWIPLISMSFCEILHVISSLFISFPDKDFMLNNAYGLSIYKSLEQVTYQSLDMIIPMD